MIYLLPLVWFLIVWFLGWIVSAGFEVEAKTFSDTVQKGVFLGILIAVQCLATYMIWHYIFTKAVSG